MDTDATWRIGSQEFPETDDPDGSADLLAIFDGDPETYIAWADENYEVSLNHSVVERIYHQEPLAQPLVSALSPERTLDELAEDLKEIGYPVAS